MPAAGLRLFGAPVAPRRGFMQFRRRAPLSASRLSRDAQGLGGSRRVAHCGRSGQRVRAPQPALGIAFRKGVGRLARSRSGSERALGGHRRIGLRAGRGRGPLDRCRHALHGPFLDGLDVDCSEPFQNWLRSARGRYATVRSASLESPANAPASTSGCIVLAERMLPRTLRRTGVAHPVARLRGDGPHPPDAACLPGIFRTPAGRIGAGAQHADALAAAPVDQHARGPACGCGDAGAGADRDVVRRPP